MRNWTLAAPDGDEITVDAPSSEEAPMQAKSRALAEGKPDSDKWLGQYVQIVQTKANKDRPR